MKKLSAVQLKQQALVFSVAYKLEEQGREELDGMVQCWFDVHHHQFPKHSTTISSKEHNQTSDPQAKPLLQAH